MPLELIPCDPAYADTAAFCARYGYPVERAVNTLVVASKKEPKQYAACVVLATTRLDVNHAARDLLGAAKCSFASSEEMIALTGMRVGGVTAWLPEGLPLYVDARVTAGRRSLPCRGRPDIGACAGSGRGSPSRGPSPTWSRSVT